MSITKVYQPTDQEKDGMLRLAERSPDLDAAIEALKLYASQPEIVNSVEFVAFCKSPLGDYIRNMPESDLKEFEKIRDKILSGGDL